MSEAIRPRVRTGQELRVVSSGARTKLRRSLEGELQPGETLLGEAFGEINGVLSATVLVALTDRRLIAHQKGAIKSSTVSWSYDQVTTVGTGRSGLTTCKLVFAVPGDQFVCTGVATDEGERFRHLVESRIHEVRAASASPPGSSGDTDPRVRLEKLEELRDHGLISEAEYADRRSAIIDQL